jgi:hypothetical protein
MVAPSQDGFSSSMNSERRQRDVGDCIITPRYRGVDSLQKARSARVLEAAYEWPPYELAPFFSTWAGESTFQSFSV